MKVKNHNHYKTLPSPNAGVSLIGITHPLYDDLTINFCMGKMILDPGAISEPRRLGIGIVYYAIEGYGSADVNGENILLEPDTMLYIPPHRARYFQNTGNEKLIIFSVLNEAWRDEFEESL